MEGKRQLEKRDFGKRLSLDSSLVEYMDSNKYIEHLLTQLEEKHRSLWREKLAVARLQREVAERRSEGAMHEKLIHELEEERHLRLQSEKRLQEVTLESERSRIQMRGLQQQFSRMEETVRNLLQSQGPPEQKKEDTVNIMVYQETLSEDERKHKEALEDLHMAVDEDSRSESSSADEGKEKTKLLLERLKALEAENSALALENENQREQYERCLDEVANQVVQALLTQKDLREECVKLKTRVFDLEQQNRTLSILFQQRLRPASDLLLQKLHSRILHLSSGDLLAEVERSRSLTQTRSDVATHECQLSAKSGAPALKGPGVGVVLPGHLCLRSRCSSSELSLSSTCSEYSSGSSCTWHDGKNLRKRPSSQNWDKRLSIDSSLPSGFASPTDELPPTRIKESHILEGLRKLQKRQVLLEPPSVITKWGYKDCMNSNEGIYSPGIKSSPKEHAPCKTADTGDACREPHQAFVYDTDSHDDADEGSSSFAWTQALPGQACRLHGCRLTHSVSDSLFSWELNGRHLPEGPSVYPGERPERLSSCASSCPSERKQVPEGQRDRGPRSPGRVAGSLQLSDTDDNDTLDELHIESSDEKSPSDLSLATDTDKSSENLDALVGLGRARLGPPGAGERAPAHPERPRTLGFLRQPRGVRRPSSEEGVAVIFDAEDGEPIELSAPQTGAVAVTRKDISTAPAPRPTAGRTGRSAQGTAGLRGRAFALAEGPAGEAAGSTPGGGVGTVLAPEAAAAEPLSPRTAPPNPQRQNPARPPRSTCQRNCRSPGAPGIYQKPSLTKIPARGKPSAQKPKLPEPEAGRRVPSSGPATPEKSPAQAPGKRPGGRRAEGPAPPCDLQPDSHWAKRGSQTSRRREGAQGPTSQPWAPLGGPGGQGEPLPRDKHCPGPTSPPPPPPPGRSVSLLIRPRYDPVPPAPAARPEAGGPHEAARAAFGPPLLKGSSAPVIASSQTEVLGGTPSVAFQKPLLAHPLTPPDMGVQTRCPAYTPCGSLVVMAPGPPKGSPKRGVPNTPPHQTLGAPHADTGFRIPKSCPAAHEPLEVPASDSLSPGRKGPAGGSVSAAPKPSFPGVNESESPPSPGHSPSASSRSHSAPHGGAHPAEKGGKPRLAAGLRALLKSPQPLRRSSTVPGKQEKDSLNEASKSSVAASKPRPAHPGSPLGLEAAGGAGQGPPLGLRAPDRLAGGLPLGAAATPETLEHGAPEAAGHDGVESRSVKRSLSSNKPHPKPALGMNGAKARSQSFSAHAGDKPPLEGPGRVRTQIITNTAERGSSLTRQSSSEGSPSKTPAAPTPEGLPGTGRLPQAPSRQGSLGSTGSACSQQGSPSKVPLRIPPPSEGPLATPGPEDPPACTQGGCPGVAAPEGAGRDPCGGPPAAAGCPRAPQSPGRTQGPSGSEASRAAKPEASGRYPDPAVTRTAASPEAPLSPSIEEKVMLCIQENVEKGQVQTKATSVEARPRPGPSFASWFGFRRSRLPALSSSRKMEVSKPKVEKKDAKGLGFGHKQLKAERKKDKKKPELQQSEVESELRRDAGLPGPPDAGFHSKSSRKAAQDICEQVKFEPRNRASPVACPTKDTFMTELLSRVDKRAAQQTESGSSNVSCRSVLKGSSQGPCLTSGSSSAQGNHKKTLKTKAEAEMPRGSLVKETTENLQEDEEDTVVDSAFQSHIIESNCQMRTLDSGIGTFPLPDSGTRSAGRYMCQADPSGDTEPDLCLQPVLCAAPSIRAQTLEREVPSSADSQDFADSAIAHSTSDPTMTARGARPLQSRLPKPASSGKIHSQKQNEAEPRPQTCSSVCAENTLARELLPDWRGEDPPADTQKLKQVEETKEDPENRLSKISLESFNKYNSNTVISLEKEKNSPNKVEGRKEEKEKNEEASLSSSDRPGVDNLESLSDSLYDSFSSCASQGSNDA